MSGVEAALRLSEIVGQARPVGILRRSIEGGSVAGAYLFFGPDGVGKRTAAMAFSAALLCGTGEDACGRCRGCHLLGAGTHPDFLFVEPEKRTLRIEQMRRIQDFLSLKPALGAWKAVVLDPAESMTSEAANAMLKTLEEPPPRGVIVLVTARAEALLPTVVSRCRRVGFGTLDPGEVAAVLARGGIDAAGAEFMAEGSPGRAMTLDGDEWSRMSTRLEELLGKLGEGDLGAGLLFAETGCGRREEAVLALQILMSWARSALRTALGCAAGARPGPLDGEGTGVLERRLERLREARRLLDANANVKLVMGGLFLGWSLLP